MQQNDVSKSPAEIDLNDLARQSLSRLHRISTQAGVVLNGDIQASPVWIDANAYQISRVIDSLVAVAVHSSRRGGQVNLKVEREQDGDTCLAHLTVNFEGVFIPEEQLIHVFEPAHHFVRANRFESIQRGEKETVLRDGRVGISIHLAKEIINAYKGKIWIESNPNKGSVFHVSLLSPGK